MNRRLARELRMHLTPLTAMIGAELLAGLLLIAQAALLTRIIAGAFLHGLGLSGLLPDIELLVCAILARGLLLWGGQAASAVLGQRVKTSLRNRLFRHLFTLGPAYLKTQQSGELVTSALEGVEQLEAYLARYLPQAVLAAAVPLSLFCYIVTRDLVSAAILFVTAPLVPFFMVLIGKSAQAMTRRQWQTLSVLSGHFLDVLRGLPTLKLFNRSRRQIEVVAAISEAYRKTTMRTLRIAFLSALVLELLTTLSTAMVAVGLGLRLLSGGLQFEAAFAVLLLTPEFFLPIRSLGTQFHTGLNGVTAAERIYAILDKHPVGLVELPNGQKLPRQAHQIRFDHVSFAYPGKPILCDLSFTIESGQTVALVGPSGVGKSTVIDILLGFIRPSSGQVFVDGVPLSSLALSWWRSEVAVVTQQTHLFAGSIEDNIRFARRDCTPQVWQQTVEQTGVDQMVAAFPDGWKTQLGDDGARLSGGQMQRVAIARAVLKQAPVWLLDEPTAHLDVDTATDLQRALEPLIAGRTVLFAAHDLATVEAADNILVLEQGRIAEQGTHAQLLAAHGIYHSLRQRARKEEVG